MESGESSAGCGRQRSKLRKKNVHVKSCSKIRETSLP